MDAIALKEIMRIGRVVCWVLVPTMLSACEAENPNGLAPPNAPPGFSPTASVERADNRVARCNTVHSFTLPTTVMRRYGTGADEDLAILSCSLQIDEGGTFRNIPAEISGTATVLTGRTTALEFREILDQGAISYIAPFSIEATSAIDFNVKLVDRQIGKAYDVRFRQSELPGRR